MTLRDWRANARGEWYVVAQVVLLALVIFGPKEWPGLPRWGGTAARVTLAAGAVLGVAGLLLVAVASLQLGRRLTAYPRPKDDAVFVATGAYAVVRHPIYTGLSLAAVGWALMRASPAALVYALVLLAFFRRKSRREEQWLRQRFPDYDDYRRRVTQ